MEQLEPKPYSKDNNYLIYPDGRVWSDKTHKFLTLSKTYDGYVKVSLKIDGKTTICRVHRLVAETFIPNPNNLPQVNHKDENKENNDYSNLEWVTAKQNVNYGTRNARAAAGHAKKVEMLDSKTKEVLKTFDCISDAYEYLQKPRKDSCISKVCKGQHKTAYGYAWRYCE